MDTRTLEVTTSAGEVVRLGISDPAWVSTLLMATN
jgi:hypothetical protein